jgi:hypothetical protein
MSGDRSRTQQVAVGTVLDHSCRYTRDDLRTFAELAGRDDADAEPTFLPDLLVIAPLTKLGGDLHFIARKMTWTAHRPVRWDEEIRAELAVTRLTEAGPTTKIEFSARILVADGEIVLSGTSKGILFRS